MLPSQFPLTRANLDSIIANDKELHEKRNHTDANKFARLMKKKVPNDIGKNLPAVLTAYRSYDLNGRVLLVINQLIGKLREAANNGKTSLEITDLDFQQEKNKKLKPCILCTHQTLDIACTILKKGCGIQCNERAFLLLPGVTAVAIGRELAWTLPNKHLQPPPTFEREKTIDVRKGFFESLMYQVESCDMRIELDDDNDDKAAKWKKTIPAETLGSQTIPERKVISLPAHKVLLFQADFFKTMFANAMKERQTTVPSIPLSGYSYETVDAMMQFLYKGSIPVELLYHKRSTGEQNLKLREVFELLRLADYIQLIALQKLCREKLCAAITPKNFLTFAQCNSDIKDPYVSELLNWFVKVHPNFDNEHHYDLSDYTDPLSLIHFYATGVNFNLKGLIKNALEHSKTLFKYDDAFIHACVAIEKSRDKILLEALKAMVKGNPEFSQNLKANEAHYRAYAYACTEL